MLGEILKSNLKVKKIAYFLIGMIFLTLGIRIISLSNLGLAFSDAILIKLNEMLKIPVALSSIALGIFVVVVANVIGKRRFFDRFECIITSFVLGFFLDLWIAIIPTLYIKGLIFKILTFLVGVFILSVGVSIYLQPKFPPHPNDLLLMTVSNNCDLSIFRAKIRIDSFFAIISIVMLAPIGLGSIFNTLCIGYFVNNLYSTFEKIYNKLVN